MAMLHRLGTRCIVDHDRRDALAWNIGQFLGRDLPHVVSRPAEGSGQQSSHRKNSGSQDMAGFMREHLHPPVLDFTPSLGSPLIR